MHLALVAALDRNRAIGRDNGLPWHLPDDLRRFRALTTGGAPPRRWAGHCRSGPTWC